MYLLELIDKCLKERTKEPCVITCNHMNVTGSLTYEAVSIIHMNIYNTIKNIFRQQCCVAIDMSHNLYLPSIIISLMRHQCSFIFLNLQKPNLESTKKLNIKWMISYRNEDDVKKFFSGAVCYTKMQIQDDVIYIWKINDTDYLYKDIVYIVKTSGTTGKSKFISVEENCIASNIFSLLEIFHLSDEIIYFGTPLTFDPSMIELFLSLVSGSCLLIVDSESKQIPNLCLQAMFPKNKIHKGVTFLQTLPSLFKCWNAVDINYMFEVGTLKHLVFGGETFPKHILSYINENCVTNVYNIYGITEMSCWASIHKVEDKDSEVSIGIPLKDTIFEVRNGDIAVNEGIGELYIGSSVRKCYINEEIGNQLPELVFRATGDLVEIKSQKLYYISRTNDVIKRFGHRINTMRVQSIIENATGLENCIMWIEEASHLILFVKITNFDNTTKSKIVDKLRVKLLHILPMESMPDFIEIIGNFPLTTNGKLDKNGLENIYLESLKYLRKNIQKNPAKVVNFLLRKYLGLNEDNIRESQHKTFSQLGGNSILLVQILNEYRDILDTEYPQTLVQLLLEENLSEALKLIKSIGSKSRLRKEENFAYDYESIRQNINIKWKYDLKACVDSSPTIIANGYVAVGSFSQIFVILNIADGTSHLLLTFPGPIESSASFSASYNYVFVGCYDGNLYCISLHTKRIVWQYKTDDKIKCKPVLCRNNEALVVGSYDKYVHCINIKNGQLVWKSFLKESITATPLHLQKLECLLICTTLGKCLMLGENSGEIVWNVTMKYPIFSTPCILQFANEKNYFIVCATVNGTLFCINSSNGVIAWNFDIKGEIFSSLANHENDIVLGTNSDELYYLEASPTVCKTKFSVRLDGHIVSTPYVTKTYIVAATTRGSVFKIDMSGCLLGHIKLMGEIFSSPVLWNDHIFIGCRDNNVYCLEINS